MNSILLGSHSTKWLSPLAKRPQLQVRELHLEGQQGFSEQLKHCQLLILDLISWKGLSEAQRSEVHRSRLLLVGRDYLPQEERESLRKAAMALFLCEGQDDQALSPPEEHNFLTLVERLFDHLTLSGRLDSYIRDSFSDIVDANLLIRQKQEIEELNKKLEEMSRIDFLTNLLNRRAILDAFNKEKNRALRTRWRLQRDHADPSDDAGPVPDGDLREHIGNFACIMIDIDHFKMVNDTYGHLAGDRVLQEFGRLLRQKGLFREVDTIGRYGGEEFIILLPDTNSEHAYHPAERLRQAIKQIPFKDERGREFRVSISMGISEFLPEEVSCDEMIHRADEALYQAKDRGRDRICVYGQALSSSIRGS